jgi:hypothetical protein
MPQSVIDVAFVLVSSNRYAMRFFSQNRKVTGVSLTVAPPPAGG